MKDGYSRLEDRVDAWGDRAAGNLADHPKRTVLKYLGITVALLLALSIIGGILNFVGVWGNEAKKVVSPANVTAQFDAVITDWQDLQAAADNACGAVTAAKQSGDPTFVEDPAAAYAATYRRIVVDYNQRQQNIFKANKVGPPGYPKVVPPVGAKPDWCSVSQSLAEIHP